MNPALYSRFEQLFHEYPPSGNEILEVGATANVSETLLSIFKNISKTYHCVGINIKVNSADNLPYTLIQCNGNDMNTFDDESFDAVTCNAVLEHDKFFWKTIAEVRRVLKPEGLCYVGVPCFLKKRNLVQKTLLKLRNSRFLRSIPLLYALAWKAIGTQLAATSTYMYHSSPHDFYRFSVDAVKDVMLEGFAVLHLEYVLNPVRIIAVGRKPKATNAI